MNLSGNRDSPLHHVLLSLPFTQLSSPNSAKMFTLPSGLFQIMLNWFWQLHLSWSGDGTVN